MPRHFEPVAPLDMGVRRDSVNTFGRKYIAEVDNIYDGMNELYAGGGSGNDGAETLGELNDVVLGNLANGQVLSYDSTLGHWANTVPSGGGADSLSGLDDVAITGPSDMQVLAYSASGGKWVNTTRVVGSSVPTYATIADMADDVTLATNMVVKVLGYHTANDGGAAEYAIITSNIDKPWAIALSNGLYAVITETKSVCYKQFGAYLDGVQDDGPAMVKCHKYADSIYNMDSTGLIKQYFCKVENHEGTIYKKNTDAITFCSDIDLSGSTILVDDNNATWFGIYVWGDVNSLYFDFETPDEMKAYFEADNFVFAQPSGDALPANTVLKLQEDPYTARDDSGYLYTVARRELMVHDANGICSSPLTDDWTNAGGEEINCQVSDLEHGGYLNEQSFSTYRTSFTYIPNIHGTFIGCDVKLNMSANKYCSVVWVKRHNATIKNFVFRPNTAQLHNTKFKNAMVYLWDCYNVTVSNLQGFNAAGQASGSSRGTSGYMLRMTNVSDVYVEDCRMQGYWGATAMDSVKNIHVSRCHMNRLDIHDYYSNLFVDACTFYNSAIQVGYGRGVTSVTNCNFFWNPITGNSYPSAHMIEFNLSYGRLFEGMVYIDNCRSHMKTPPDTEFNIFKMEFSPDATSITKHFKFPEIVCRNVYIWSNNINTHLAYFKITGTRRAKSGMLAPSHVYGVSNDGTVTWQYYGRGVNWDAGVSTIDVDGVLRVTDSFLDRDEKTQFYNKRYYVCTKAGTLDFSVKPTDTSGTAFACGTAMIRYAPEILWKSKCSYNVGDLCASSPSNFYPLYLFRCIAAGTSNGYFPTHTSGTVLDGINDSVNEPDGCWWTYVGTKASFCTQWTSGMTVTVGQRIIAEGRLYEVVTAGTLDVYPPYDNAWFGESICGTAELRFVGQTWSQHAWYARGSYCEARGKIYQLANHDGTTSGVLPTRGNPYCVDGDVAWRYVEGGDTTAASTWASNTAYAQGSTVISNGHTYKCVFDGKLVLPNKTIFENITTNIASGNIFWFYSGTDIPTKQGDRAWTILAKNCEGIDDTAEGISGETPYFCHSGNPNPTVSVT